MFFLAAAAFRHVDHPSVIRQFLKWHIPLVMMHKFLNYNAGGRKGKPGYGIKMSNETCQFT